ncbi:MAG: glyoxalase/bleomycin resistance/dioxygenase family protein [Leptolyngbya sp. SIO4C1]|nr:glyoxalase/bleomycin resistance/dioxygenase family protein [Leptolyngbya sp. SIO4C1]
MPTVKTHVALRVSQLDPAIAFYRALFEIAPVKHKPGYAKFDLENPGLNLTLNVSDAIAPQGALSHLGIQVESTAAVEAAIARLQAAGLETLIERDTDCCYALQDKVWVSDPDGNRWEIFVVKVGDTAPDATVTEKPAGSLKPCCA